MAPPRSNNDRRVQRRRLNAFRARLSWNMVLVQSNRDLQARAVALNAESDIVNEKVANLEEKILSLEARLALGEMDKDLEQELRACCSERIKTWEEYSAKIQRLLSDAAFCNAELRQMRMMRG